MADHEQIILTVLSTGIAFYDADALRLLRERGMRRTLATGQLVRTVPKSKMLADFLSGYPDIRDLDHYRELVQDPRSEGPLHWFSYGTGLVMERTSYSHKSDKPWYVIVDTAIGGKAIFIEELQRRGLVSIQGNCI